MKQDEVVYPQSTREYSKKLNIKEENKEMFPHPNYFQYTPYSER